MQQLFVVQYQNGKRNLVPLSKSKLLLKQQYLQNTNLKSAPKRLKLQHRRLKTQFNMNQSRHYFENQIKQFINFYQQKTQRLLKKSSNNFILRKNTKVNIKHPGKSGKNNKKMVTSQKQKLQGWQKTSQHSFFQIRT